MPKRIKITSESDGDRNQRFHDNFTGADMTRAQFIREIEHGQLPELPCARNQRGEDARFEPGRQLSQQPRIGAWDSGGVAVLSLSRRRPQLDFNVVFSSDELDSECLT